MERTKPGPHDILRTAVPESPERTRQAQERRAHAAQRAMEQSISLLANQFAKSVLDIIFAELKVRPIGVRYRGGPSGIKVKSFPCPICRKHNKRRNFGWVCQKCYKNPAKQEAVKIAKVKTHAQSQREYRARQKLQVDRAERKRKADRERIRIKRSLRAASKFVDEIEQVASNTGEQEATPIKKAEWDIFS